MTRTPSPTTPTTAADAPDDAAHGSHATDAPVTVTEAITTSVTGMLIGGAALWFLAPICFSC